MRNSRQLLADYATTRSEPAFRELVTRYIDLVYSTALRLVDGDAQRAEDVAQTAFVDLSRDANKMLRATMVGGWLHRHTCFIAAKVMRGERRRLLREQKAVEMNALNAAETSLADIGPVLDEVINELGDEDPAPVLREAGFTLRWRVAGKQRKRGPETGEPSLGSITFDAPPARHRVLSCGAGDSPFQ